MADKQIIDGVDVSGCPSYMDNGECTNKNVYPDYCKACSNCIYKLEQRLKTKEQVIEKLEKIANELADKCFPDKMQASYDCYGCCGCCSDAGDYTEELGNQLKELVKELKGEN